MKSLNKLAKEIHEGNKSKGFYDDPPSDIKCLMLICSKVFKALEADRNSNFYDKNNSEKIKDTFEGELSNIFIRVMDFAGYKKFDFDKTYKVQNYSLNRIKPFTFYRKKENFEMLAKLSVYINKGIESSYFSNFETSDFVLDMLSQLVRICDYKYINLELHVEQVLSLNAKREYKHGKEY